MKGYEQFIQLLEDNNIKYVFEPTKHHHLYFEGFYITSYIKFENSSYFYCDVFYKNVVGEAENYNEIFISEIVPDMKHLCMWNDESHSVEEMFAEYDNDKLFQLSLNDDGAANISKFFSLFKEEPREVYLILCTCTKG